MLCNINTNSNNNLKNYGPIELISKIPAGGNLYIKQARCLQDDRRARLASSLQKNEFNNHMGRVKN